METINNSGVYWIVNRANNKRYLGSSGNLKSRWRQHKSELRGGRHKNYHLQRAFEKYGEEKFEFEIVAYMDVDKALAFEDYLLKHYPTMFEYNIAKDATAPMLGRKHSEEAKQKIAEANSGENNCLFGKHLPEETKQKISKANSGKTFSDETRRKISEAKNGHTVSEETRKKISESERGKIVSEESKQKMRGRVVSDETRAKIGEAHTGIRRSEETRAKIGEAHTGIHRSEETRAKISKALTGTHPTEATRAKMRKAQSGNKSYKWIDISERKIMEMKSLREQGYSYEKIAKIFGISRGTVQNRLNKISPAHLLKQEEGCEAICA